MPAHHDIDPDAELSREDTAAELSRRGFRISPSTLATIAARRGAADRGPPFRAFGGRVYYRWGDAFSWAQGRTRQGPTASRAA